MTSRSIIAELLSERTSVKYLWKIQSFGAASILITRFKWGRGVKTGDTVNLTINELCDDVRKAIRPALRSLHLAQLQIHCRPEPKHTPVYLNLQAPQGAQRQADTPALDHPSVPLVQGERPALRRKRSWIFKD